MADELTDEQKKQIANKFNELSKGGETIPKDQAITLARSLKQNPTNKQVDDALAACELTEAESLTLEDCEAFLWSVWYEMDVEKELREAFARFDKDGNGYLDANEFKEIMQNYGEGLTDDELTEMYSLCDINEDGKIDYEEFVKAMTETEEVGEGENGGENGGEEGEGSSCDEEEQ